MKSLNRERDELSGEVVRGSLPGFPQLTSDPGGYLALSNRFSQFIIVTAQSFTQHNLDRFGVTWLLNAGKSVDLVDLSLLVWGELGIRTDQPDAVEGVLRPTSWNSFGAFLSQHGPESLVGLFASPLNTLPLFELVEEHPVSTLHFDSGRIPIGRSRVRTMGTTVQSLATNIKHLLGRALRKRPAKPYPQFNVDYLVMSGKDCEVNPLVWLKHARNAVYSHAYDYVIWDSSDPFVHDGPYIVFLDQAYPENRDAAISGVGNPLKREVYYPEIENFLQYVSSVLRMPVLVAIHPRFPYADG